VSFGSPATSVAQMSVTLRTRLIRAIHYIYGISLFQPNLPFSGLCHNGSWYYRSIFNVNYKAVCWINVNFSWITKQALCQSG